MAEKLKDRFLLPADVRKLGTGIKQAHPAFDRKRFLKLVLDGEWEARELKQRMRHLALSLGAVLPDFAEAVEILSDVAQKSEGFMGIIYSEYVECFGIDDPKRALPALREFTRYGSAEFAVRPFLVKYPKPTLAAMRKWTKADNEHVRRLASEGCRPRLPWAMALPQFKEDPEPILPILEALKDDEAEYVRKSVANNLNDISKDHPERVLEICEAWLGHSKRTDWIVKRACRTLLKAGNTRAMVLFGFADPASLRVTKLKLATRSIAIGDQQHFSFELHNDEPKPRKVRLEYRVEYAKARGKRSSKIFQIKETELGPGLHAVKRKQSFKNLSTRKHYPGTHTINIVVNGVEKASASFELMS